MAARTRQMVALWQMLRQPFTLPVATAGLHECCWEHIDLDVLGCKLCGRVHACADGRCSDTEEVEDAVVCRLSGVVVRDKLFVETEFVSHVNLMDFVAPQNVFDEESAGDEVHKMVGVMLCSETAKTLYLRSILTYMLRWRPRLKAGPHLGLVCTQILGGCVATLRLRPFDYKRRKALVKPVATEITKVMKNLVHSFGMPLKEGEVQSVTVGVLYLMRKGVDFEDITVLSAVGELEEFLPSESMLSEFFNVKSRTITESENRVKFALRSATRERLRGAGFRERRTAP